MVRESVISDEFFVTSEHTTEEDFNISVNHFHQAYEIYYLDKGSVTYFVGDSVYSVKVGEFVLVKPNVIHTTKYSENDHKRLLIYFKESFIKDFLALEGDLTRVFDNVHLRLAKTNEKRAEEIMRRILIEYESEKPSPVLIKCLLGELIKLFSENKNESLMPRISDGQSKILSVISFINQNYKKHITLEALSKVFYLNPSYLSRSFKEETGIGFKEYLISVRLKEAAILLKNTDLGISEIYVKVGFCSQNHFCKTFKAAFGVSPLKFRKYA